MSDMRFTIIGIVMVFTGFLVLGVFGNNFQTGTLESNEFDICYEYFEDKPPIEIDCSVKVFDQTAFFLIVIALMGTGIISLVKGVKGDWDNKVKPEDMAGPSRRQNEDSDKD